MQIITEFVLLSFVILGTDACSDCELQFKELDLLEKCLDKLNWKHAALLYNANSAQLVSSLASKLTTFRLLLYQLKHAENIVVFRELYHTMAPNVNIILVGFTENDAWDILNQAYLCDLHSNKTTEYRHHSRWIVLTRGSITCPRLPKDFLENIVFVINGSDGEVSLRTIHNTKGGQTLQTVRSSFLVEEMFPNTRYGYNNRTMVISVVPSHIFLRVEDRNSCVSLSGPIASLLQVVAKKLNISYEIRRPPDRRWGVLINGSWDGLVRQLQDREVDFSPSTLVVHEDRAKVMDFVQPAMYYDRVVVLYKMVEKNADFKLPLAYSFQKEVFLVLFIAGLFFSALYPFAENWLTSRTQTTSWCSKLKTVLHVYCFALSSLIGQAVCVKPRSLPGKVLLTCWWVLAVTMVTICTATLTASLTVKKIKPPFTSLSELVTREDYTVGMSISGVNEELLRNSSRWEVRQLWRRMVRLNATRPEVFSLRVQDHLRQMEAGKHAVFLYSFTARELIKRNCNLGFLSEEISWQQFAFGMPKNSPLNSDLQNVFHALVSAGIVDRIIIPRGTMSNCTNQDLMKTIRLEHLVGAFVLAALGIGVAVCVLIGELISTLVKKLMRS